MKGKIMKQEKGITLIALVITIIVLLILAGVAISMLSGENGILTRASEAKTQTDLGNLSESIKLSAMTVITESEEHTVTGENFKTEFEKDGYKLNDDGTVTYNNEKYAVTDKGAVKATIKELAKEEAVVYANTKLTDSNNEQIVVPVGFKIKKDTQIEFDGEILVKGGIVVGAPDGSEFVWVPVKGITKMATETSGTDTKGRTNYQGKLYDFSSTDGVYSATEKTSYGQGTTGYREPSLVTENRADTKAVLESVTGTSFDANSKYYNTILGYSSAIEFGKAMQEDYNEMVESVKTNKGFYVGRYETSLNTTTKYAQSKLGETSATAAEDSANTWYGLYQKQKEYSEKNTTITNSVGSSMIWGSQYDQMMIWMQSNNIDVTKTNPINLEGKETSKNTSRITGSKAEDKLNNIYDLLGNSFEWSLEACNTNNRIYRGDNCYNSYSPSYRSINSPDSPYVRSFGSRLTLYVK